MKLVPSRAKLCVLTDVCQTLPGLPRAARPSGRFAEGKTPQTIYFGLNMRQTDVDCGDTMVIDECLPHVETKIYSTRKPVQ